MERVPVPSFFDLPLPSLPPVLDPVDRARRFRPHRELRRLARPCHRDGIALGEHPACSDCGALSGPLHQLARELVNGRCPGCRV